MNQISPETRHSLILRLPTMSDAAAWEEFVSIYEPLVVRFAKRHGLQDADARELVQNVLIAVARSVSRWKPDPEQGKFRTWLFRIARNQLLKLMTQRDRFSGGGREHGPSADVGDLPERSAEWETLRADYERELFRTAAAHIRPEFHPRTWNAFWMSFVDELSVEQVATDLQMTPSAVYVARCRVVHRLKELIKQWESGHER
ncbi:MAG: sigma-70 family RNA polymerase sigma factor [Planctomyces sp.]|nr:sigma-70 family RNA polymerase sigma factor [Planctomyces sp.]